MKNYVQDSLDRGKIRPTSSPTGASLFSIQEKYKSLQCGVDYRALNRITKRNNSPLPRSDGMFDMLGDAKVFSKMDLKTGFHETRLKYEDIGKTVFNTRYHQFEYLVMPSELCNVLATLQSVISRTFHDCVDVFIIAYLDDLVIFSKEEGSHIEHLNIVLSSLHYH